MRLPNKTPCVTPSSPVFFPRSAALLCLFSPPQPVPVSPTVSLSVVLFVSAWPGRDSLPFTTGLTPVRSVTFSITAPVSFTTQAWTVKRKSWESDTVLRIVGWEGDRWRRGEGLRERKRLGHFPYRRPCVQWGSEHCQHLSVQKPRARESGREGGRRRKGGSANLGRSSEAPENIGHWPIFHWGEKKICCV